MEIQPERIYERLRSISNRVDGECEPCAVTPVQSDTGREAGPGVSLSIHQSLIFRLFPNNSERLPFAIPTMRYSFMSLTRRYDRPSALDISKNRLLSNTDQMCWTF